MAIRFNWRRNSDNEPVTHVSATWHFTREDLAHVIIAAVLPVTYEQLEEQRTKAEIEEAIRGLLYRSAEKRFWWADEYAEEYDHEPTSGEVLQWGREQAARF